MKSDEDAGNSLYGTASKKTRMLHAAAFTWLSILTKRDQVDATRATIYVIHEYSHTGKSFFNFFKAILERENGGLAHLLRLVRFKSDGSRHIVDQQSLTQPFPRTEEEF